MQETSEEALPKPEAMPPPHPYNQDCEVEPASGEEWMGAARAWRDCPGHSTETWGRVPSHSLGHWRMFP